MSQQQCTPSSGFLDMAMPAPDLAPRLLGCRLHSSGVNAVIAEVEAYQGEEDGACHAHKGRTPRSDMLYQAAGTLYCYRCYGIHTLLNMVCDQPGTPAAVLVRGVLIEHGEETVRQRRACPTSTLPTRLANGPGKVTQALAITMALNGQHLADPTCPLQLSPGETVNDPHYGPRVGIAYAPQPWRSRPWRWWLPGYPAPKDPRSTSHG